MVTGRASGDGVVLSRVWADGFPDAAIGVVAFFGSLNAADCVALRSGDGFLSGAGEGVVRCGIVCMYVCACYPLRAQRRTQRILDRCVAFWNIVGVRQGDASVMGVQEARLRLVRVTTVENDHSDLLNHRFMAANSRYVPCARALRTYVTCCACVGICMRVCARVAAPRSRPACTLVLRDTGGAASMCCTGAPLGTPCSRCSGTRWTASSRGPSISDCAACGRQCAGRACASTTLSGGACSRTSRRARGWSRARRRRRAPACVASAVGAMMHAVA